MDIYCTNTPDRIFRRIDDGTALLLLTAFPESFKRLDPRNPPVGVPEQPKVPYFYCAPSAHTGNVGLHVRKTTGETQSVYKVRTKEAAEAALGAGEMPQSIWDAFAAKTGCTKDPDFVREQSERVVARNRW